MFEQIICFVGEDLDYSSRCLEIIDSKGLSIAYVVGPPAEEIVASVDIRNKEKIP